VENAAIDFFKVEENENTIKYLISAVKKNNIDNLLAPFKRINRKVSVVNTQPMALISLLEYQDQADKITAIIDVGYSATQITIADKKNIYLSRTIDTGGNQFTETLMEINGEDYQAAEERKFTEGLNAENEGENKEQELIDSIQLDISLGEDNRLNEIVATLSAEITRSFDYFNMKNRGLEISKVFLTGGGSRLKGLKQLLKDDLNQEIFEIDPFKNTSYSLDHQQYCDECKNEFAVAVGLGVSEVMAYED
jgi:type IV pilus assembly protein PilM